MNFHKCSLPGSYTVELALLIPLILLVIFSVLYGAAHIHNRSLLTISACEDAISGNNPEVPAAFALTEVTKEREEDDTHREISFNGKTKTLFLPKDFSIETSARYELYQPVKLIRASRALSESAS